MESSGDAHGHGLRDDAIAVWREWLVVVHKPRRLAIVKERDEHRKRISRANANIAAGSYHSLALQRNGNITCLGNNDNGQAPPDGIQGDFIMVAAGDYHSLALQRNGSIACWGDNDYGQAPPDGIQGDFVAIAAGGAHSLAIRRDGSIACWGRNVHGEAPPDGMQGDFVAIDAGEYHSLALRRDGSIGCWGYNGDGRAPTSEDDEMYDEDDYATLSANFPFMTDVHIL